MNRVEQSVSSSRCGSTCLHVTGHHPFPSPVENTGNSKRPVSNTMDSSIRIATAPKAVAWSGKQSYGGTSYSFPSKGRVNTRGAAGE